MVLVEERMKLHIAEANANLAIGAVWANHSDNAKRVVLGSLNELEDLVVPREENIAFLEVSFILNHIYNLTNFLVNCKQKLFTIAI